jgi:hypothetical protein
MILQQSENEQIQQKKKVTTSEMIGVPPRQAIWIES